MRNYYSFSLASILALVLATPAMAQEAATTAPEQTAAHQGVISYKPEDFASSQLNTALDLVARLPGFSISEGNAVRGFAGAAGNVLIDGQRPTTKSDSVQNLLAQIQIGQVERVDLIRGGAPGIDMQGQTVIVNVIRKKQDSFTQAAQARTTVYAETGKSLWAAQYQATLRSGESQYDLQVSRGISFDDSVGFGRRTTLDVATGDVELERSDTEGDGVPYSLKGSYKGPAFGGTLSVNGLIGTDEFKSESHFINPASDQRFIDRSQNDRAEVGVNYKRALGEGLEMELLALSKASQGAGVSTGEINVTGQIPDDFFFRQEATAGESIGRGVLRYTLSPELSFEGGGETAFNYRDQQIALTENGVPRPLPASDVRVEEERSEAFLQGTWRPVSQLSLEAGVRVERSTITQSGTTSKERSFTYPKPRLVATWSPTKDDQIRARIEREVGQLDFQQFASSVDLNSSRVDAGNSDLQPDKTWAYELTYEKRFWEGAAAVLTVRHEDISDVIDRLPFDVLVDDDGNGIPDDADNNGVPDTRQVQGIGNIGDGTNDVIALNLTLPFANFGWKGAELKIDTLWQNSEVTDPFTGEKRRISGQRPNTLNVSMRQELPEQNLVFEIGWYGGWQETAYFRTEVQDLRLKDFYFAGLDYKPTPNFTLSAGVKNFDPYSFHIQRRIYDGPRATGSIVEVETETRNSQVLLELGGRLTF